jgi:hypothetical protein
MISATAIELPTHGDALLLPSEAAALLRRETKTLAQWRSLGKGPRYCKIEGRIAYRACDLAAFIEGEA